MAGPDDTESLQPEPQPVPRGPVLNLREHELKTAYANTCVFVNTREEFILDFGLALPAQGTPDRPQINMLVSTRVIMNVPAAKRLAIALSQAIQRYENTFGVIPLEQRPIRAP